MNIHSDPADEIANKGGLASRLKGIYSQFSISDMQEPSRVELIFLWLLTGALFAATILYFRNYTLFLDAFGDNGVYMNAASAIRRWDFNGVELKQFWGFSYLMASLSFLSGMSERASLLLISGVCSLASVLLARNLWGGWIAGFFAVLNFAWLQRSFLGGAEPLFMVLLLASFWAVRRARWVSASCLSSLATVTRPVGMILLIAIGIVLLIKREYKRLMICTGLALVIGMLYILPFWIYFQDPLHQVNSYRYEDWQSGSAIGLPFFAIAMSIIHNKEPWTNLFLTVGWIVLVLIGIGAMFRKDFRPFVRDHLPECLFAFFYIAFLFTYNSPRWVRAEFIRFAIPILPFVLISLRAWIPKRRVFLYGMGFLFSIIAACSAIGIKNVFSILR